MVTPPTPGGGGPDLRSQLAVLAVFFAKLDFVRMHPADRTLFSGVPEGATARVLSEPGRAYALYVHGGTHATLIWNSPQEPTPRSGCTRSPASAKFRAHWNTAAGISH